jgi:hypothetical protein
MAALDRACLELGGARDYGRSVVRETHEVAKARCWGGRASLLDVQILALAKLPAARIDLWESSRDR